jgi:ribonuclease III
MSDEQNTQPHEPEITTDELQERLGLWFRDGALLAQAMTHRSFANEGNSDAEDNERLEFLGDAVLNFLSADLLYRRYPEASEGQLTQLRAALVRTESLSELADQCELGLALRMGKGEERSGGRFRKTNLCAAFEGLIGALYTDQGIVAVRSFVGPLLEARLGVVIEKALYQDARTVFQEWSQSEHGVTPRYTTVAEEGPEHEKNYVVQVRLEEKEVGRGMGRSKRAAAQSAARDAIRRLQRETGEVLLGRAKRRRDPTSSES